MDTNREAALEALQERIGYQFRNPALLHTALTHPSRVQAEPAAGPHNQRLEFLGDAILAAILTEALYRDFPEEREGRLSRNRSILVRGASLATLARELDLVPALLTGEGEFTDDPQAFESMAEDALEALAGAIYLDSDWRTVHRTVLHWFGDLRGRLEAAEAGHNPKGRLQELVQPRLGNQAICYELVERSGPDHGLSFTVQVLIEGQPVGQGSGRSKKLAEEAAARAALESLAEQEPADQTSAS